ncbi:MAG TPA: hypothetical protein VH591_09370 [Ktedonobacterales bacterium]|jgi:hypothetical protein
MHPVTDNSSRPALAKRSLAARLATIAVIVTLLVVFMACGVATVSNAPVTGTRYVLPTFTPEFDTSVQQTVIQFCQAISDGNYNQAYGYLSAHYKRTVSSPTQLANQLPSRGKIAGCMEFGEGHFIKESGDHATDSVMLMMTGGPFGNTTDAANVGLVRVGSTWQIDSISQ